MEAERRELHQALEMVKENAERQVRELEQENVQLSNTVEVTAGVPFALKHQQQAGKDAPRNL